MTFMRTFICGLVLGISPALAAAGNVAVLVRDRQGQPLPDAVVTLTPAATVHLTPEDGAVIEQKDRQFNPRVSVIGTGAKVWFPNRDRIRHHVYSFSPAKKFDIKLYAGDPPAPVVFDRPGLVVLGCNIHDWMIAYLYVTDAPYYGKTDAQGRVVLTQVPAGQHALHLWHPDLGGAEVVKSARTAGDNAELSFQLDVGPEPK